MSCRGRVAGWVLAGCLLAGVPAGGQEAPPRSFPGVLVLKDGRKLKGEIVDRGDAFEIKMKFGVSRVRKDEVLRIDAEEGKGAGAGRSGGAAPAVEFIDPYYGTVVFKDGRRLSGDIVERRERVEVHRDIGMVRLDRAEVERIEKCDPPPKKPRRVEGAATGGGPPAGGGGGGGGAAEPSTANPGSDPGVVGGPQPPAPAEGAGEVVEEPLEAEEPAGAAGGLRTSDATLLASAEAGNRAYLSARAHYDRFSAAGDRGVRKTEILAALADIRTAAGTYAGLMDVIGDDAWLQARYHQSIEVLKVIRMRAAEYR
ncbi:MAG: hypothetical protein HZA54_06380 [Planctomycetes bacterium]|nr:hypothetical protein [Planctomycetota bacterium]